MFEVDNSGQGNCMFYAYSISLIYYLRAKNDPILTQGIFDKLKLDKESQLSLNKILSKPANLPFSKDEIAKIIEPKLGRAVRDLAADQIQIDFDKSPQATSLFTSTKYGMEFGFKHAFPMFESKYGDLIDHEFDNEDYTKAEIYHNDQLKLELEAFVVTRAPHVISEMQQRWAAQEVSLSELELSDEDKKGFQKILLSEIIDEETVEFFRTDDNANMKLFLGHIKKEFEWGSEETLMTLHRAVQGEKMVRNLQDKIDTTYDFEIRLHLHKNGNSPFHQTGTPDIILNNSYNVHWTSKIPDHLFTNTVNDEEEKLFELLEDLNPGVLLGLSGNQQLFEDHRLKQSWAVALKKEIEFIKKQQTPETREKAIQSTMSHISKGILQFGLNESFRDKLSMIFSAFLNWIPQILKENKKVSSLSQFGLYSQTTSPSQDGSTKTPNYPSELVPYVKKSKHSGPRVAGALETMHQHGIEGDERYTNEKCRTIAQRYLDFVKSSNLHTQTSEVKAFVQKMDVLIQEERETAAQRVVLV